MPTQRRILFPIRESQAIPADVWDRFAELAQRREGTITAALAGLIRRYLEQPEPAAGATPAAQRDDRTE